MQFLNLISLGKFSFKGLETYISNMDLTSILSENGRELKLLNGFKFTKSINTARGEKWRCCKKSCNAVLIINGEKGGFWLERDHNHEPYPNLLRNIVNNYTKTIIRTDELNEDPTALFWKEMSQVPKEIVDRLSILDLRYLRKNFYRKLQISREKETGKLENHLDHKEFLIKRFRASLNRMHVMEGECDKSSEMVAESAPELVTPKTSVMEIKLVKEELPSAEPGAPEPLVELPVMVEPLVNGDTNGSGKEEKTDSSESVKSAEQSFTVNVNGDNVENRVSEGCRTKEENVTEPHEKDDAKETKEVKEVKEVKDVEVKEGSGGCSEEEDRQSVTSSQSRKRVALVEVEGEGENSSSESDGGGKRPRLEPDDGEDERERLVREYVEECTESVEEMNRAADKLQREIGALGELLRAKELEWNSILRLRKLKEEMLERLLRRRRLTSVLAENGIREEHPPNNISNKPKIININNVHQPPSSSTTTNNGSLMMVPIVSSGPGPYGRGLPRLPEPRGLLPRPQRPILPKPGPQEPVVGEGRSRHPENVPRRGRRMRGPEGVPGPGSGPGGGGPPVTTRISGSPALMSMANMALGSGSHVRENPPFMGQDNSRPSSADSSRSGHHLDMLSGPGSGGLSFKDALVHFAKMNQPNKPPPPPPPYPEVTLHPVSSPHSPPAPPPHSSLLHGILTKSAPGPRATTFSPTLARLLTAPERAPNSAPMPPTPTFRPPHHHVPPHQRGVNISEILSSSKKNRNEITITPVSGSNKAKDDVVMLQDEDEEGDGDRLVIDEGRDSSATAGAGGELPENVPQCQGCHQRAAQFVCAGCGNQWYCSRDCQVNAWEEHSEMCSG